MAKVCFDIDDKMSHKVKALPKGFNLSAKLREALDEILERKSKN